MLDLCKIFGVEEGEEFKIYGYEAIYFILNGYLYIIDINNTKKKSYLNINDVAGKKIIKLPKKKNFSQDTLNFFKCIDKEYKWIAKDKDGEVCIYINKPKKEDVSWDNFSFYKPLDIIKDSLFTEIKWEDEEPVYIDDYVERQKWTS